MFAVTVSLQSHTTQERQEKRLVLYKWHHPSKHLAYIMQELRI